MNVEPLTPDFGARVTGVEIARPLDFQVFREIRIAFDDYSVLVFPGQALDDDTQVAFSERFGPCEPTVTAMFFSLSFVIKRAKYFNLPER